MNVLPTDSLLLQQLLTEAQLAYNRLMTGTMARVVVDQNGERVEFTATNRGQLYTYIRQLQGAIGTPIANAGPAQFFF